MQLNNQRRNERELAPPAFLISRFAGPFDLSLGDLSGTAAIAVGNVDAKSNAIQQESLHQGKQSCAALRESITADSSILIYFISCSLRRQLLKRWFWRGTVQSGNGKKSVPLDCERA